MSMRGSRYQEESMMWHELWVAGCVGAFVLSLVVFVFWLLMSFGD
jgi:hypothetical protein